MRDIDLIVVHCSATPDGLDIGAKEINVMHLARGFAKIGYHFVIRINGALEQGRQMEEVGAHVEGHNAHSLGICLVGGLDHERKPADTFKLPQFEKLVRLLSALKEQFPGARVCGHRDLSPDLNHDGKIERNEWMKECPCFDVAEWLAKQPTLNKEPK